MSRAGPLPVLVVIVALASPGGARAQPATPAETLLHLSATGTARAAPDQPVADLVAQATSPSAATAQRRVNGLIADALKAARGVPGVEARAVGYTVAPAGDGHAGWTARQTLELGDGDGPALLDLVGRLQEQGLVAASLDWQLSPALRQKAHDEATLAALRALQARAATAAAALGLHVDHLRDVRLDAPAFVPRPLGGMMAMAARAAPPQATAAPAEVTAEASADVVLRP